MDAGSRYPRHHHAVSHPHDRNNPHDSIHSRKCDYRWSLQFFGQHTGSFFRQGFTWNTRQVKPDLVAPGVDITSCAVGGGYESRSGTSMAAPFVAGSCALLMQWGILQNNDCFSLWRKNESYLIRGARQLPFSVSYPNPQSDMVHSVSATA